MYREPKRREGNRDSNEWYDLEQKEEINIQLECNEETRLQINKERLRNLQDNIKRSNIWIMGCQKDKKKSKKLKTYLKT